MRDIHSSISAEVLIASAVHAADTTPVSIDLQGFNACEIILAIGAGGITFTGTHKIEFKLTHSDNDTDYDPVTVDDMLGLESVGEGGIIKALVAAHATASAYRCGYKGSRRYLRLLADFSGTHGTGTPFSATAIKGHATLQPVAPQA